MKFKVTVIFDRINPKTGKLEKNSSRFGTLFASDRVQAKQNFMEQFTENEPTRRRIHEVKVEQLD